MNIQYTHKAGTRITYTDGGHAVEWEWDGTKWVVIGVKP